MSPYEPVRKRLRAGEVVILDGGIGTEILRRNVSWADHQIGRLPELVRSIHEDYIRAGADVITTNTFQLSRRSFLNHFRDAEHMRHIGAPDLEERAEKLLRSAVELAREARSRASQARPVAIAGSVTTLEWCFRPDLAPEPERAKPEYLEIFRTMAAAGVDLVLLETLNSVAEAKVALAAARELGLPAWVSFVCDSKGRLFSGDPLTRAVEELAPLAPDAILLNCAPPDDITTGLAELCRASPLPTGAFAHVGRFDPPEWLFTDEYPPEKYLECARRWREMGATVVGGCCGTTPEHILALKRGLGA